MAKSTSISPLELAQKYLQKIGVDKLFVQRALLPSLFEENILFKKMTPDNLVTKNKVGNKFTQTHIYINSGFRNACFTPTQEAAYKSNPVPSNNQNSQQSILVFEANIADLLNRRSKKLSTSVVSKSASQNYAHGTSKLLDASTTKLFNTQGSSIQVHIGIQDDNVFKDFRLGILLDDYLIMLKYANKDCMLAISIPSEFCAKYNISGLSKINRKKNSKSVNEIKQYEQNDCDYSSDSNSITIKAEITPNVPTPAPSGTKRSASNKVKYHGKPSRGKGALDRAKYTCEFDCTHVSFISQKTGENYMEPHHLIPISNQGLYDNDIDITPNLICLCPTCHKQIHYGTKSDVKHMLETFYNSRHVDLKTCGIDIDLDTLFAYYDIY
jgi:hypothetical protein